MEDSADHKPEQSSRPPQCLIHQAAPQALIGTGKVYEYESKNNCQIDIDLQLDIDTDSKFDLFIPPKDSTCTSESSNLTRQLVGYVTASTQVPLLPQIEQKKLNGKGNNKREQVNII